MAHARKNDPITSKMAAKRIDAANCDKAVAALVLQTLGKDTMTDEEIAYDARWRGANHSYDRIRHGRLLLARLGMIEVAGRKKLSSGAWGRTWRRTK